MSQHQQPTADQVIEQQQQQLNALKVRIYDVEEQARNLQQALNTIAKISGFTGDGSINDLCQHIHESLNPEPITDIEQGPEPMAKPKSARRKTK